ITLSCCNFSTLSLGGNYQMSSGKITTLYVPTLTKA
ncbi:lppC lipofamily protein, partial [Vibrio parahaemolyticus V-223/04]